MCNKKTILINDSIMGAGKTSHAIERMNAEPDKLWMFSTPFLEEVQRIKTACPYLEMKEPQPIDGRKLNGMNYLLSNEENISLCHACLTRADRTTFELLEQSNYNLILDEVIDCLIPVNQLPESNIQLSKADIRMLINKRFISVDEYGQITWLNPYGGMFTDLEDMADAGNLFCIDDDMFFWRFPPRIWELFDSVEILTYMFEASQLKAYFDYYGIAYKKVTTVSNADGGGYMLADYSLKNEISKREEVKKLVTVYGDNVKVDGFKKDGFLSKSWYSGGGVKVQNDKLEKLKKAMINFVINKCKVNAADVMWTTFNAYESKLAGRGYTRFKKTPDEIEALLRDDDGDGKIDKYNSCFVACNARASNRYGDRHTLMYMVNVFPNKMMLHFFDAKNAIHKGETGYNPIEFNSKAFSLSCFLQWVWRSAIRNGEPINVFVPSKRIRNLFADWLNGADVA